MAIIDSAGLFLGDRLAWCSDEAQLHWPRLYSAANNYARLELNYRKVMSKAYANFRRPPSEQEFWAMIREFKTNFLLFVYEADGVIWGQWQTNERYLLGYKNADDKRSPAPPVEAQEEYRRLYLAKKQSNSVTNEALADLLGDIKRCGEMSALPGVGVGVGEGVGKGKEQVQIPSAAPVGERTKRSKPEAVPDPRHQEFRLAFRAYFLHKNPALTQEPWDAQEAAQLSRFLKKNPNFTGEQWKLLLTHRARSTVLHGENLSAWIGRALNWTAGPTDRFGNQTTGGNNASGKPTDQQIIDAGANVLARREARRVADEQDRSGRALEAGSSGFERDGQGSLAGSLCGAV